MKKVKKPQTDLMLRELRGNAVDLHMPQVKGHKGGTSPRQNQLLAEQRQYAHQQYPRDHQYPNIHAEFSYQNVQRSLDGQPVEMIESEAGQSLIDPKIYQYQYVNEHGGGLIPPANFTENPFTSYLKSIGTTVGQINQINQTMEVSAHQHHSRRASAQQTPSISHHSDHQTSRNLQRRQQALSLQPRTDDSTTKAGQQSDEGLSRIQLKGNLSSSRKAAHTVERSSQQFKPAKQHSQYDILTKNLEPEEMRALRVANPLHHAFNTHLAKVITSVQRRKKGELSYDDNESQQRMMAITDGGDQLILNRSEADALIPSQRQLSLHMDLSQENQLALQNTPARVRAEARRELALMKEPAKKTTAKPYSLFKPQIEDKFVPQQSVVDQVTSLLNRVNKNKDQVFIPLELEHDKSKGGVTFRDAKNLEEVHGGQIVFTKGGFISIAADKNSVTEMITKEQYITEGIDQLMYNQVPFFRKFLALKTFKQWKQKMQRNVFQRTRAKLANNFIFARSVFSQKYRCLIESCNELRFLKMIETKENVQYGKHFTHMFDNQCSTLCANSVEDIEIGLKIIHKVLSELRDYIKSDDAAFIENCEQRHLLKVINEKPNAQELVPMTKTKNEQAAERKQRDLMKLRQTQYNALVQLISRILFTNISECLVQNKVDFAKVFCQQKPTTQFEISVCLDGEGRLATTPTAAEHRNLFKKVFSQMEDSVFKNYFLTSYFQDLVHLLFWEDKSSNPPGAQMMRKQIAEIEALVMGHKSYLESDAKIAEQLTADLQKLDEQLENFADVEEVYEFTHDWNEKRKRIRSPPQGAKSSNVSAEIEFYKTTWVKLEEFEGIIEKLPVSHTKIGTIVLETASLKKLLSEMPKQIVESIRTNVTQTIESETKALKDDLSSTSETLEKQPTTLNIYVDQVNTLKYLKEKQEELRNKFDTIIQLQKQCKQDNIKISLKLTLSIEEVAGLYSNLPKLMEQAQYNLNRNKYNIEQSMLRSSEGLSLKIKAFEKKYVETYLQDKQRLDRCKETLDELMRRSQAIVEMKSKVVLYKEFLKILYEDEPDAQSKLDKKKLSCAQDQEFMEEVHKGTIKMWKMFLYWSQKRNQCFTSEFIEYDMRFILKAIAKVTKYLNELGNTSEFIAYKAQPITRVVNSQVKDTAVLVDFVKEMNKDTLKRRHWSQIFSLLKAPHLKNSTTFTIVDLREFNIQQYAADIRLIIEHATTEAKYETVFLTIKQEWDESSLQIIPFKEQINDYVLTNGELMSEAIEENLSTLDTLVRSQYAAHIKTDVTELITKLKTMLEHLLVWVQAQKYWLTLDPIYNSGLFSDFFGESTKDFIDTRQKYRRIMWSSYRRPKTSYCLLITDRLPVFQHLIHFYAMIQKQVNMYLEKKRLQFARFYFLTDSQFLDMLMLANSNQDFSVYINMLFQGAQKLFVTRLIQQEDLASKSLKYEQQLDQRADPQFDKDLETQLEQFISQGKLRQPKPQGAILEEEQSATNSETLSDGLQDKRFNFDHLDNILAKPTRQDNRGPQTQQQKTRDVQFVQSPDVRDGAEDMDSADSDVDSNLHKQSDADEVLAQINTNSQELEDAHQLKFRQLIGQNQALKQQAQGLDFSSKDFVILGFVSTNKELLLFDQHVSMSSPIEQWLSEVELSMQDSLRKQMIDAIENFLSEPIEEWVLDYPQQICYQTLSLILSQEINDVLSKNDYDGVKVTDGPNAAEEEEQNATAEGGEAPEKKEIPSRHAEAKGFQEIAMQIGRTDDNERADGKHERRKARKDADQQKQQVILRKRPTLEPELDHHQAQIQFLDETFGEQAQIEAQLDRAVQYQKLEEQRYHGQNQKKTLLHVRKPDYKEQVLGVLQFKGLASLYLRLQFWINKMMKLLYRRPREYGSTSEQVMSLPGVQRMRIKSLILFLKHQQEQVDTMIQLKVMNINDFEWQSKVKITWTPDGEAQVVCGGFNLNMGYEYLGTEPRIMLSPLTSRYFVFMSSALREKQSAILGCSVYQPTANEIVKEFASLCGLPFKSHTCTASNSLSILTQLLNGGAMANSWVFFEHLDNLTIEKLQIFVKEIQLLHEQFIVSGFTRNLMREKVAKSQGLELHQVSTSTIVPVRTQMLTLGIFGSASSQLAISERQSLFVDQVKSSFRSIAIAKPNYEHAISTLMLVENFTEYRTIARLYHSALNTFFDMKRGAVQESCTAGHNTTTDGLELSVLRQVVKHATLIRNQEFGAYYEKQLEKYRLEQIELSKKEQRVIYVVLNDKGRADTRKKLREEWVQERQALAEAKARIETEKHWIEIDSLREATKQTCVQKFLGEFVAHEQYKISIQRTTKTLSIDMKSLEDKVVKLVEDAFAEVVEVKRKQDVIDEQQAKLRQKMIGEQEAEAEIQEQKEPDGTDKVVQLAAGEKLQHRRDNQKLQRKDSLVHYKPRIGVESKQTPTLVRHKSSINMFYKTERQIREDRFGLQVQQHLKDVAKELHYNLTEDQVYNCLGVVEAIKRQKGIAIVGPINSGKTQLIKFVTLALKKGFNTLLRTSYISPKTFSKDDLYGPVLAFDQSSIYQLDQPLQAKSVFQLILNNYQTERQIVTQRERDRSIQAIYIDQDDVDVELMDSFNGFLQLTNLREREYLTEQEFLLDFAPESQKLQPGTVQNVPVRFPNGNVTLFPSDMYIFFECQSLKNASPSMLSQIAIVNTQTSDVTYLSMFQQRQSSLKKSHEEGLLKFEVIWDHIDDCMKEFVSPFLKAVDKAEQIKKWPLWNMKSLTTQFFNQMDSSLYRLIHQAEYQKVIEEEGWLLEEMQRDVLWNLTLTAVTWSYGAVLNKELRRVFDDQFASHKSKFNIGVVTGGSGQRLKIFDIFFDIQKLQWVPFTEKLEYKLKSYYEPALQALLLPTTELSQAFYMLDNQVQYMKFDKELNKAFRLIGPSASSKSVILNTFANKIKTPTQLVSVPMTSYLTLEVFRQKVELNYRKKRENSLVPRDAAKQILLIVDDVHLQRNSKVELLEFIRSWSFCRGYFSVDQQSFKKVSNFGVITAENVNFAPTSKKQDRFLHHTTTLYCNEIEPDQYKYFIQSWLTSNAWNVSHLVSRFYLLISNSLLTLIDKMQGMATTVNSFSYSKLTGFQYVQLFCSSLVQHSSVTDSKQDVYGLSAEANSKSEEDAVAELFCYEAMRTFGDRMMRPQVKMAFMEKLAYIAQKEFLASESFNALYIEQIVLGNYHEREEGVNPRYKSLSFSPQIREEAIQAIRAKSKRLSGNTFLPLLLDSPQGLADCFRLSRVLYKPSQHLMLLGQTGVSKLEMLQLAAITNNVPIFEVDAPAFGAPLHFAYNLRQILLSVAKISKPSYIVMSDQVLRDPIYYDFIYNYISQLARHESFVMFDNQFFADLGAIEAQHIKKQKKVAVPGEYALFKYGIERLQKNVHFVFMFNDMMTYKEVVQLFPQLEYSCEVLYMEDLTQQDYLDMTNLFLFRKNVSEEFYDNDMAYSKSLLEVRNRVKQLLLQQFYSKPMLQYTMREEYLAHGGSEFIFPDQELMTGNVYQLARGYMIKDLDLHQILLNMPMEVQMLQKNRYGVFLEVSKFLFDLLSMHLSARRSYYETFLAKTRQFHKFFGSVKESKQDLHEDQNKHSFRVAMATDKIREINKQMMDGFASIKQKQKEIAELTEELNIAEEEIANALTEKNNKLDLVIDDLRQTPKQQFINLCTGSSLLDANDIDLIKLLYFVLTEREDAPKNEAVEIFLQKDEVISILDQKRHEQFTREVFQKTHEFSSTRIASEFQGKPLIFLLYTYVVELYRKLNIKNTMAGTFNRIKEMRQNIDTNVFSINFIQKANEQRQRELQMHKSRLGDLEIAGSKLSRKIEEAELSYMRTDQIHLKIEEYSIRISHKLQSIVSRQQTLLGDSILLAASIVYLGIFAPEEREQFRAQLCEYLYKVRHIQCNRIWIETSQSQTANPNKSMFIQVLKDLGLRDILFKANMPAVLSTHQFGEALFAMLFAPSCPVICDPTGVVREFVQTKLLANMDTQVISGADLQANNKLKQALASNRPSIVIDVNCFTTRGAGLSHPHQLLRTLSNTLYNGVDFDAKRLGQLKKIGSIGSYLSHATAQNKRIPILSADLEHISLYQAQVFQPRYDFQMTQDYAQNATFICAAPSLIVESRSKLEENGALVKLKELIIDQLLPKSYDFTEIKDTLNILNRKILKVERNYENEFLVASGDTFKRMNEYSSLRQAVEDVITTREQKLEYANKYRSALKRINLVTEASDVIFSMYLVLKFVGKQTNSVTYSWSRFMDIVSSVLAKLLESLKVQAVKARGKHDDDDTREVEIEIDNRFFKQKFVPLIHQFIVASLRSECVPLYNLYLSLRLAQTYRAISSLEHHFILKQLIELKGYQSWRDPNHKFVQINETVDKNRHQNLRRELLRLYPDVARQVFDQIEKNLGQAFQYLDASIFIQKELKEKFKLTQVQQLTFGFLCPDTEFKSKLTLFMYTQNMATFDFTEEVSALGDFLAAADTHLPITLNSLPTVNPINLVTTLAHHEGRDLIVLRSDPTYQIYKLQSETFNMTLTKQINSQLLCYATLEQAETVSFKPQPLREHKNHDFYASEILSKHEWLKPKERDVNLDEGKIFFEQHGDDAHNSPHVKQILRAAQEGSWVLLCPVQFPHTFPKLLEKLGAMREVNEVHPHFRLIVDIQNFKQNEVADSFVFESSYVFHLTESNHDRVTTLSDIWSKILNPRLLERLTDQEAGNRDLKTIEYRPDGPRPEKQTQFMQVFSEESQDQHAQILFHKFIEKSAIDFSNKLKQQRKEALKKMESDKQAEIDSANARDSVNTRRVASSGESASNISGSDRTAVEQLTQEKAAIQLAGLVARVGETEGPRLETPEPPASASNASSAAYRPE